ncbi:MAG: FtsX-like permease family protein [Saprospiraceae bacterium]|nr:FtsX-like permease family protein [Saprospiraceae bacterium]
MSSIVLGVAALVAINSFNYNLRNEIEREAATLLGADLAVTGNKETEPELLSVLDSLPGEKAMEKEMLTMVYIPKSDETQFIRLKALQGDFPFYGKIKTEPSEAAKTYRQGPVALVDKSLSLQHGLKVGDTVKIGETEFPVEGLLESSTGSIGMSSSVAPTIFIDMKYLEDTDLERPGSLINYAYYYKVPKDFDIEKWKTEKKKFFKSDNLRAETITDRKANLNRAFGFLNDFLNLVAIVALLLGCIGVASSVWIYIKSKINSIALLRCIGMKPKDAFLVYFIQIMVLGCFGVLVGAIGGVLIQTALPLLLKDFLPVSVEPELSFRAISEGILIGLSVTALFALLPLISIRNVSPLLTLRSTVEGEVKVRDKAAFVVYGLIFIVIFSFLWMLTGSFLTSGVFISVIVLAYLILSGFARLLTYLLQRFTPENAGFVVKQGISNLFRPDNQTSAIMVTIGMGTAVLTTLVILQSILLSNVALMDEGKQPNMIIYGIESNQMTDLKKMTIDNGLPIIQEVPVVTMKIDGWKGKAKTEWMADSTMTSGRWAANREARVTYRDTIDNDEILIEGTLKKYKGMGDSIFVSLGTTFAEALDLHIGDELVFNVQGTRIVTYVGSTREIEFRNLSTRFFIVFPTGVLEEAPQFQVLVTKTPDTETMTTYRTSVVKAFPNISVVDLTTILRSVNEILKKVSFIIRFMAIFSLLTGFIVLISSLTLSKYQRLKESVLLRTLGASKSQIFSINAIEYFILGTLSALTGVLISLLVSYAITKFQLKLDFSIDWWSVFAITSGLIIITVLTGLFHSRDIVNSPPLEVLRKETD